MHRDEQVPAQSALFFTSPADQKAVEDDPRTALFRRLELSLVKDRTNVAERDVYTALAFSLRDRLIYKWMRSQNTYYKNKVKQVYYLSMEYLMGRLLGNTLINLDCSEEYRRMLDNEGYNLESLRECEHDMGLGNGGLGRLAACFLDSMATLELPAFGYGIRYEFGIFEQDIQNGHQVEKPDNWLRFNNPWEIQRPEHTFRVRFNGRIEERITESGRAYEWKDTDDVLAVAYDTPIPGYKTENVNNLRLWSARSTNEFDLTSFNRGDYVEAVSDKARKETISKVLYPNDSTQNGKTLRLMQQYFFVSASIQDIVRRHKRMHDTFDSFSDMVCIQLNDTHPAIAIPELMRILLDEEKLPWDKAWAITTQTFAYTNHTLLPEALEKWTVELFEKLLPRHMRIIYDINHKFLEWAWRLPNVTPEQIRVMSIIEEGPVKQVRMANLAVIGSFSVNGVAALHTEILKQTIFHEFAVFQPAKFNNKTNGVTQRRWIREANPRLSALISEHVGTSWLSDLYQLRELEKFASDASFVERWREVKWRNKKDLIRHVRDNYGVELNPFSIFDVQVKRIHEYKRQLLNILHVIALYNKIKAAPREEYVPRTVIIAGKAAPSYQMAKLIIKLTNNVANIVNNDPDIGDRLKVVFMKNYSVSLAQLLIPAADLSEQISTAGYEASGTGNMKFQMNGALTIGTMDGANVEMREEVGDDNIFIFGLLADEVVRLRAAGYNPLSYYDSDAELKAVLDALRNNVFSPKEHGIFDPIVDDLLYHGDRFCILADFRSYLATQREVERAFVDRSRWSRMSVLNVARSGKFSTDRTIHQYAEEIWNVKPIPVPSFV